MKRFFSKTMPIVGHITAVLTILTGGILTYMTLRIVSSKDNESNSSSSISMSIFGTILSSIMSVIMYVYSDATKMLTKLGQNIDNLFAKIRHQNYEPLPTTIENGNRMSPLLRKFISLFAIGFVSSNVIIAGINTYQSSILLVDRYLDLYPDMPEAKNEEYKKNLIWFVVYVLVFAGGYRALAFEGSFAAKLVESITSRFSKNVPLVQHNSESDSELLMNANAGVYFQYTSLPDASHSTLQQILPSFVRKGLKRAHSM